MSYREGLGITTGTVVLDVHVHHVNTIIILISTIAICPWQSIIILRILKIIRILPSKPSKNPYDPGPFY